MEELKMIIEILENRADVQYADLRSGRTRAKADAYEKTMHEIADLKRALKIMERFAD